jgi:hypothetical protein
MQAVITDPNRILHRIEFIAAGSHQTGHATSDGLSLPAHLAMWEGAAPDSGQPETEWGEHVTDHEYPRLRTREQVVVARRSTMPVT